MAKPFRITIPVRAHLRPYLLEGREDPLPLQALRNYKMIEAFLQRPSKGWRPRQSVASYQEVITIEVSDNITQLQGCVLTEANIHDYNESIEQAFREQLFMYLDLAIAANRQNEIKELIPLFCEEHDIVIDEMVQYETLRKAYQRARKKRRKYNGLLSSVIHSATNDNFQPQKHQQFL